MMYLGNQAVGLLSKPQEGDWTDVTKYMSSFSIPTSVTSLPKTITIDLSNHDSNKRWFNFPTSWTGDHGYRHIIVKNSNTHSLMLQGLFQNYYPQNRTEAITCTFEDGLTVSNTPLALQYIGYNSDKPYPKIYGEIDLSLLDGTKDYGFSLRVGHIEFKPNTCSLVSQFDLTKANNADMWINDVDKETIINIGNVLKDGVQGTIALHTAAQERMNNIIGQNDTSKGYNFFVSDENGVLSLYDFITTIKGWTIQ